MIAPNLQDDESRKLLESMRKRLSKLTVAVLLMALAVMLCAVAVFSSLANYFGGDLMINSLIFFLAAISGFIFGWFAGRKA